MPPFFLFYCCGPIRDLHSFPTRRSSDLFADAYDKLLRATDGLDLARDLLAGVRDYHQAKVAGQVESDRKSTRLNSSHVKISYAVFCLKKKNHPRLDRETQQHRANCHHPY